MKKSFNFTQRFSYIRLLLGLVLALRVFGSWIQAAEEFRLADLVLIGESDRSQCTNFAPQLEWRYSHAAENYLVEIRLIGSGDTLWESGLMTTTQTEFRLSGLGILEPGRSYQFQLRAKHPALGWSPLTELAFTMNTPPTTPHLLGENGRIIRAYPILLRYRLAHDEQKASPELLYQLQVAADSGFVATLLDTTFRSGKNDSVAQVAIRRRFPDDRYYFVRLRASDGVEYSAWSPVGQFALNCDNAPPRVFDLLAPKDGSRLHDYPELRWEKASDPDEQFGDGIKEYQLELSVDSLFRRLILQRILPPHITSYRLNALDNHQHYYWRVKARDKAGAERSCRKSFSFLTDFGNLPPEKPQLIAPSDSTILNPRKYLEWFLPADPENDLLSCEISIFSADHPQMGYKFNLSDSLLLKAASAPNPDLAVLPNGQVRVRLSYLGVSNRLIDGHFYRWAVRVKDSWGSAVDSDWLNASFIYDDGINQPPSAPSGIFMPHETIVTTRLPKLQWGASRDPDVGDQLRYQVMLSREARFAGRTYITQESALNQTELNLTAPLVENDRYYWRVRAIDLSGIYSEWSPILSFWVNSVNEPPPIAPRLLAPTHLAIINPQTYFFWQDVPDPDPGDSVDYYFEMAHDAKFLDKALSVHLTRAQCRRSQWRERNKSVTEAIGISLGSIPQSAFLRDNALYYWRVIPVDRAGLRGPAATERYRVAFNQANEPPYAVSGNSRPRGGEMVTTLRPELVWEATSDPDFDDYKSQFVYQVELSPFATFPPEQTRSYLTEPGQTTLKLTSDLSENTRWFYRIRAQDKRGAWSEWSPINNFITNAVKEPPYPVTAGFLPRDSMIVTTQNPTLTWLATDDPDPDQTSQQISYIVRYFTVKDGKRADQVYSQPGVPSVQLAGLKEDQYYYYQIAAVDPDGKQSEWSATIYFGVNAIPVAPDPFQLLAPRNKQDSVAVDAAFYWSRAFDRDPGSKVRYTLLYSLDSTFTTQVAEIVLTPHPADSIVSYLPPLPFEEGRRYFWKVVATDEIGLQRWGSGTDKRPFSFRTFSRRGYASRDDTGNEVRLLQNFPNPFNVVTHIQYEVPEYTNAEVAIYDLLGQRVRLLASGAHPRGVYSVYWDGTDDKGAALPGGVYILRLTARGTFINRKVILLR